MALRILMLDDEPDYGELFVDTFAAPGIDVVTFVDPEAAVADALRTRPNLIFLDFRLPETTANQVAPRMPAGVPIYILSGELDPEVSFPCEGIITKPFKRDHILALIASLRAKAPP